MINPCLSEHENFYSDLSEVLQMKGASVPIIMGDFNVRLGSQQPGEQRYIGQTHSRTPYDLEAQPPTSAEACARFLAFLVFHGLRAVSTDFPRPSHQLVTYRVPGQTTFCAPWRLILLHSLTTSC